jgi:hypothetical protein
MKPWWLIDKASMTVRCGMCIAAKGAACRDGLNLSSR